MGSTGLDHNLSVKKFVSVCGNDEGAVGHFGTLMIQRVDDGESPYHIVECKLAGTSVSLRRNFFSTGTKDPEGRAAAFCFALSTGGLPAFRSFLFQHYSEFASSGSTCLTDPSRFTVLIHSRKNAYFGLCFSAAVCRLQDGSMRSISFRSDSVQDGFEPVTAFFHGPKLRSWVLRAVNRGTPIAGELENCRSDDMPMAKCERCGGSEFSGYSNQKRQQAREESCCSACLMMERKAFLAIMLEDQAEVAESWKILCSEAGSLCTQNNLEACCVCGCEDNEDLDDLVPCICQSKESVAHTSCLAACKPVASMSSSNSWCLICGQGVVVSPHGVMANDGIGFKGLKRSMPASQVAGGEMKRPRTSETDGVKQGETIPSFDGPSSNNMRLNDGVQTEAKEPNCTKIGSARHVWRSADTPAVVPFKKRRIQVSRSPSPPPKSLFSPKDVPHSPQLESNSSKSSSMIPKPPSPKPDDSDSKNAASFVCSMPLTSGLSIPDTILPLSKLPPAEATSPRPMARSPKTVSPKSRSLSPKLKCPSSKSLSPKLANSPKHFSKTSVSSTMDLPKYPYVRMMEESVKPLKLPEQQGSKVLSLHCDMPEVIQETDICYTRPSSKSPNQNKANSSQEVEDGELVISTEKIADEFDGPYESPEVSSQVAQGHGSQGSGLNGLGGAQDERAGWDLNTKLETWDQLCDNVADARTKVRKFDVVVGHKFYTNSHLVRANKQLKICRTELAKEITGVADVGSGVPTAGHVPAARESEGFVKLEADVSELGKLALKVRKDDCELQELFRYKSAENIKCQASLQRIKAEDGAELAEVPEVEELKDYCDFDCRERDHAAEDMSPSFEDEAYWKGEDASDNPLFWERDARLDSDERERKGTQLEKPSTSGRVRSSGWDQLPEGFESAEEALRAAQEVIARRGRGSWVSFGGRSFTSFSAHRFNSGRDDIRESSRLFGDRYHNDSSHRRDSSRGFPRRAAAGGQGRGSYKGWSEDRQHDSIDEWGFERHRSTSRFSLQGQTNAAVKNSGFVASSEGTLSSGSISRRGMQSKFVDSHGVRGPCSSGRAPSADMERGSNFSRKASPGVDKWDDLGEKRARPVAGTGFAGSKCNQRVIPGRVFGDRYRGSYINRTVEPRRSVSPLTMHLHDHQYTNNCHSPGSPPVPRFKRSRFSPPSPEPLSRSKFHPPSTRNQHSPPPFYKWSHDQIESDNIRERDFRRPAPRFGAPGRTSPHVVHGSSLMDDRDLQVLAGTRTSGARGGWSSYRDESPDVRRQRRAEEEGCTSSFSRDSERGDMKGIVYKRDRSRDDGKKREPYRLLSRSSGGHRRSSSYDGFDEVTPRRHRP